MYVVHKLGNFYFSLCTIITIIHIYYFKKKINKIIKALAALIISIKTEMKIVTIIPEK